MQVKNLLKISIFWTLYLSIRFHGRIIIARRTRIQLFRGARINLAKGSRLTIGRNRYIATPGLLCIKFNGQLTIDGDVTIFCGTRIVIDNDAHLEIGNNSYINSDSAVTCFEHIAIGSDCAISWNTNILDGNAHELTVAGRARTRTRPLEIGDNVWIGTGATIVGATIGHGTVVGAGSVVTSNMPPEVLVAGNPARVTREEVTWEL
jgi:acetyltransferase-like isoleucine patch superfamily enzyme